MKNIFSTFTDIAKKETAGRSQVRSLIKDMHSDVVTYRREHQAEESPAVDTNFSIEEFRRAYRTLQITTVISTSFLAFMLSYLFFAEGILMFFSVVAFSTIGLFWHLSFVIRAYRARLVYDDWDNRHKPLKVTSEEISDALMSSPKAFLPFLCPLKSGQE